jgi:hypothetical protein
MEECHESREACGCSDGRALFKWGLGSVRWRKRAGRRDRRSSSQLSNAFYIVDHGKCHEADPERQWHLDSGGSDANGDHGLDKMPESNKSVMPLDQQHKPDGGK